MKSLFFLFFLPFFLFAQTGENVELKTANLTLKGTLLVPKNAKAVVLIIAGSGPTDRNGNNAQMPNNSLKMLAEGLYKNGIASLRYDKRAIGESVNDNVKEKDLRFDNYIEDAEGWIHWLKDEKKFAHVAVFGHSEGSLIGMVAAKKAAANSYISAAGAGEKIDLVLRRQLGNQLPFIKDKAYKALDTLAMGKMLTQVPAGLEALFRPDVQPYLISWFRYDPSVEIRKLSIPVFIVQGDNDIQVEVSDAENLHKAKPDAKYLIIKKMNHIFKNAPTDKTENMMTYMNPTLPVMPQLIKEVSAFVKKSSK